MAEKETKTELKKPTKQLEKKPEVKQNWSSNEKQSSKDLYGCEILVDNGTLEEVSKTEYPNDASIITYHVDDKVCLDLTRGSRTALFDMYYDKFKKGLKEINWGKGTISPKVWGYTSKTPKKKK
tara:strand:+ start:242 stop:613 length:372 start_codon:yes stop_codon:yes gene_type:complete